MTFRVGICTRFYQHEATHIALRLGDWFRDNGYAVSFFSPFYSVSDVSLRVPLSRVLRPPRSKLTTWCRGDDDSDKSPKHDMVIWTHVPSFEQLNWVRSKGIRTAIVPIWHEIVPDDFPVLKAAHLVLSVLPSMAQYLWCRGVKNTVHLPWDTGEPFTRAAAVSPDDAPLLLLPLYERLVRTTEGTGLTVLARVLAACPRAQATVLYNSASIAPQVHREMRTYRRALKGRLQLAAGLPAEHRHVVFQQHTLTVWPTHMESTCMTGLSSVSAGTPVLTFHLPTTRETFTASQACFVPTQTATAVCGVPYALPDYQLFERYLRGVLDSADALAEMREGVLHGLPERRNVFHETLNQIVG